MHTEIERKFLVNSPAFVQEAYAAHRIVQGYICSAPGRTVRVRIRGDQGYLTIKGPSDEKGLSRYEFEQAIPVQDAEQLLRLCEPGGIDKTRYLIRAGKHTFEVDIFQGENKGLILAEVELETEDEPFEHPAWLGKEVSGDRRYYNSMLAKHPFSHWEE